jgi:hypothetical protein
MGTGSPSQRSGVVQLPASNAEDDGRVELYPSLGVFMDCFRVTFTTVSFTKTARPTDEPHASVLSTVSIYSISLFFTISSLSHKAIKQTRAYSFHVALLPI